MSYSVLDIPCSTSYWPMDAALFDNLRLELRRGAVVLAVLAALRAEQYGYTLRKALAAPRNGH